MTSYRTEWMSIVVFCAAATLASLAAADGQAVPLQLQMELTVKVIEYAQRPSPASVEVVRIGILTMPGSAESMRFATQLKTALDRVDTVAGRPHEQSLMAWNGATSLDDEVTRQGLFLLYLAPGLDLAMPDIARALEGRQVMTVASDDSYVPSGAILGFALVSGHPKMVFNIGQARKQDVAFRSAVMRLMRVIE